MKPELKQKLTLWRSAFSDMQLEILKLNADKGNHLSQEMARRGQEKLNASFIERSAALEADEIEDIQKTIEERQKEWFGGDVVCQQPATANEGDWNEYCFLLRIVGKG